MSPSEEIDALCVYRNAFTLSREIYPRWTSSPSLLLFGDERWRCGIYSISCGIWCISPGRWRISLWICISRAYPRLKVENFVFKSFSLGPVRDMHIHREMAHLLERWPISRCISPGDALISRISISHHLLKIFFNFQAWIIGEMHIHRLFPSVTLCECLSLSPSPLPPPPRHPLIYRIFLIHLISRISLCISSISRSTGYVTLLKRQ